MVLLLLSAALAASALSADPCATGTPVVVDGKTYGTKTLVVTPAAAGAATVEKKNTKVAAGVVGALTQAEGGSTFWKSDGDFAYVYGQQPRELIVGFDVGSYGMKLGETRQICIPPDEGYAQNAKPGIPANSTLVFTLSCHRITAPAL